MEAAWSVFDTFCIRFQPSFSCRSNIPVTQTHTHTHTSTRTRTHTHKYTHTQKHTQMNIRQRQTHKCEHEHRHRYGHIHRHRNRHRNCSVKSPYSLICIPPERLAKSVHPERHVCPVFGCPGGGSKFLTGDRAVFSRWIWSGLNCTYLSVSLNHIKTTRLLSLCVTKPCTTPEGATPFELAILSPSLNPGPVLVQFSPDSKGCMKVRSAGISKSPWIGKLTVAMRSPWIVQ